MRTGAAQIADSVGAAPSKGVPAGTLFCTRARLAARAMCAARWISLGFGDEALGAVENI
jgi:hypothetical protein